MIEQYRDRICAIFDAILEHERSALEDAAKVVARTIRAGGVVHVFGSGHSSLAALEVVSRSGSFVPVNQIIDRSEDMAERLEGYGSTLMRFYEEQYGLMPHDCLIVISNSGRNPLPIEVALAGKERGLGVIAVTNISQSQAVPSRREGGQKLFEVADVALDTHAPFGEVGLELPSGRGVAPISSFPALFLVNGLFLLAAERLERGGEEAALFQSENGQDEDAAGRNAELRKRYAGRLRRFGV